MTTAICTEKKMTRKYYTKMIERVIIGWLDYNYFNHFLLES